MEIKARVTAIRFSKPGWVVSEATLIEGSGEGVEKGERFKLVGSLEQIVVGDLVSASGAWVRHPSFGLQFKASSAMVDLDQGSEGVETFLKRIPFIGSVTAARLVRERGADQVLAALEGGDAAFFQDLRGITEERSTAIIQAYTEQRDLVASYKFLAALPLEARQRTAVLKHWAEKTKREVERDPYILSQAPGIRFVAADRVARHLGIAEDDSRRLIAIALAAVEVVTDDGATVVAPADLKPPSWTGKRVVTELGNAYAQLDAAIAHALEVGALVPVPGGVQDSTTYAAESSIALDLKRLAEAPRDSLTIPEVKGEASDEQWAAVERIAGGGVLVLTGGPGSGKTFTVRSLITLLDQNNLSVALAAPTGKAAARMREQTGRKATTIHRLLGWTPDGWTHHANNPLSCDALVLDEASMIDTYLFASVLDAIPSHARLVIVGDVDQLPSIGPGQVLSDLIESGDVPTVRLTKIFRQPDESMIPWVARDINEGRAPTIGAKGSTVSFGVKQEAETAARAVVACVSRGLQVASEHGRRAFAFDEIQVLSPMRKGPCGVDALNLAIQDVVRPVDESTAAYIGRQAMAGVGDRVIVRKNMPDLGVVNGDMGHVVTVDRKNETEAMTLELYDGRQVTFPRDRLKRIELAYALTIHSSQGSQFPCVVMPIHKSQQFMLTRALVYTGITRASEFVGLIGQREMLSVAARNMRGAGRRTDLKRKVIE